MGSTVQRMLLLAIFFLIFQLGVASAQDQDCANNIDPKNTPVVDVISCFKEQIGQLKRQMSSEDPRLNVLLPALKSWPPETAEAARSGLPGGNQYSDSSCPAGYYAVGLRAWGAPGNIKYCIGCLVAVQLICRPINTQ